MNTDHQQIVETLCLVGIPLLFVAWAFLAWVRGDVRRTLESDRSSHAHVVAELQDKLRSKDFEINALEDVLSEREDELETANKFNESLQFYMQLHPALRGAFGDRTYVELVQTRGGEEAVQQIVQNPDRLLNVAATTCVQALDNAGMGKPDSGPYGNTLTGMVLECIDRMKKAEAAAEGYLRNTAGSCPACAEGAACGSVSVSNTHKGCYKAEVQDVLTRVLRRLDVLTEVPAGMEQPAWCRLVDAATAELRSLLPELQITALPPDSTSSQTST